MELTQFSASYDENDQMKLKSIKKSEGFDTIGQIEANQILSISKYLAEHFADNPIFDLKSNPGQKFKYHIVSSYLKGNGSCLSIGFYLPEDQTPSKRSTAGAVSIYIEDENSQHAESMAINIKRRSNPDGFEIKFEHAIQVLDAELTNFEN